MNKKLNLNFICLSNFFVKIFKIISLNVINLNREIKNVSLIGFEKMGNISLFNPLYI